MNPNTIKKSAVTNSKKISQELYDLISSSKRVEQEIGRVSVKRMKPDMFTIEIYSGNNSENWNAKVAYKKDGNVMKTRSLTKTYDFISIKYKDWFNGDTARKNFKTPKEFNTYLDKLRQIRDIDK